MDGKLWQFSLGIDKLRDGLCLWVVHALYKIVYLMQPNQLSQDIKYLFQTNDQDSIKYILGGETPQSIEAICKNLPTEMGESLRKIYQELPRQEEQELSVLDEGEGDRNKRIDDFLQFEQRQERNESFLQFLSKANQKLIYEQHFGFPFYDLVKRILLTHGDTRPQPTAVKAVHSQLQILYGVLFSYDLLKRLDEDCPNLNTGFREYLCAIFPQLTQKYFQFRQMYRSIKKEATQKPANDSQDEEEGDVNVETGVRDDITLQIDEKEFLVGVSDNAEEFQIFEKNRSYNFLCFGLRKYQAFIALGPTVFSQIKEREFCELLSFLSIRFIRRMTFAINRERNKGSLKQLTEPITQQQVRSIGNDIIDSIAAQVKTFLTIKDQDQNIDQRTYAIFQQEFEPHHYVEFIPRSALRAVLKNETLPQYVWRTCKEYKHIWRERVKVDHYFKQGGIIPQKSEFLAQALKNKAVYQVNPGKIWKDYLMRKFGFNQAPAPEAARGKKRSKLDSCIE